MSLTGGGAYSSSGISGVMSVNSSFPIDNASDADAIPNNAWKVYVDVSDAAAHVVRAYAICAGATSVSRSGPAVADRKAS